MHNIKFIKKYIIELDFKKKKSFPLVDTIDRSDVFSKHL